MKEWCYTDDKNARSLDGVSHKLLISFLFSICKVSVLVLCKHRADKYHLHITSASEMSLPGLTCLEIVVVKWTYPHRKMRQIWERIYGMQLQGTNPIFWVSILNLLYPLNWVNAIGVGCLCFLCRGLSNKTTFEYILMSFKSSTSFTFRPLIRAKTQLASFRNHTRICCMHIHVSYDKRFQTRPPTNRLWL